MNTCGLKLNDHVCLDDGTEGLILRFDVHDGQIMGDRVRNLTWLLVGERRVGDPRLGGPGPDCKDKWFLPCQVVG